MKANSPQVNNSWITRQFPRHVSVSIFWAAVLLFLIPVCFIKIYNVDIWWHLQIGKSIIHNFAWPDVKDYYFTPVYTNIPDFRYTFLGDISLYLVHAAFGDVGLQVLKILMMVTCVFLLMSMTKQSYNGWALIGILLFILGTYQKQILRNSIFELPLLILVFWLWYQFRYQNRQICLYLYPVVLGVWSCLHGSYLLGFGLFVLLLSGDIIDRYIYGESRIGIIILKYLTIIVVGFLLISWANPVTKSYYNIDSIKHYFTKLFIEPPPQQKGQPMEDIEKDQGHLQAVYPQKETQKPDFFDRLKKRLNNTLWTIEDQNLTSGDFVSPFDKWGTRLYVKISFMFGVLGLIYLMYGIYVVAKFLIIKLLSKLSAAPIIFSCLLPVQWAYFFTISATIVLGFGYLRLTGDMPMVILSLIFITSTNRFPYADRKQEKIQNKFSYLESFKKIASGRWQWFIPILIVVLMYVNMFTGFKIKPGVKAHFVGFGKISAFADNCQRLVLSEFPTNKVFTTFYTGGYLLYKWFPHKKVFIDTFFAPHKASVFNDYNELILNPRSTPDFLFDKYHVDLALIDWGGLINLNKFFDAENWQPLCIDQGMILYQYQPDLSTQIPIPRVLVTEREIKKLPVYIKKAMIQYIYTMPRVLLKRGRLADAKSYIVKNRKILETLGDQKNKDILKSSVLNIMAFEKDYGLINSKTIRYELLQNEAILKGNIDNIIVYGSKVIEAHPDRLPIYFNIVLARIKKEQFADARMLLDQLWEKSKGHEDFLSTHREKISKAYHLLYEVEKQRQNYLTAYKMFKKYGQTQSPPLGEEKLLNEGLDLFANLDKQSQNAQNGFDMLQEIKKDFPHSGRIYNEIAWYMLEHKGLLFADIKTAKQYALQAVKLMKKNNSPVIDLAYDTLSKIYLQLNDKQNMQKYKQKAIDAAPAERKKLYE